MKIKIQVALADVEDALLKSSPNVKKTQNSMVIGHRWNPQESSESKLTFFGKEIFIKKQRQFKYILIAL